MTSYHLYEKHLKDKPYHYEYSDISNLNLLKEYEFSRRKYIIKLKKVNISKHLKLNQNFKFFLSKKNNYWPYPHKKTEEILKLIVTKKKYEKVPLWVNEIIRKFEVSKRIRKFYNKDRTKSIVNTNKITLTCIQLDSNQRRLYEKRIMSPMPSATWR